MSDPPVGIPQFPLANPKKVEHNCELCNKPAYLQCSICRVTFYWFVSIISYFFFNAVELNIRKWIG